MYNDIIITLKQILQNNGIQVCSNPNCKRIMIEGYVINGGEKHYCSDECLHTEISEEYYNELCKDGDTYYIRWIYCKEVLKAINTLIQKAPVLQEGEFGIKPICKNNIKNIE